MKYPNFSEEKKLWRKGYKFVVGLDESGRGPLAGPVVAASIMVSPNLVRSDLTKFGLRDSKKLSKKQREFFYNILTNHKNIKLGIGIVSEKIIDKINILEATKLAMVKSIEDLKVKMGKNPLQKIDDRRFFAGGSFLLIDGNFDLDLNIKQKSIVAADEKVFSCVAAGIIAKVTRDRMMQKMHKLYPQYGLNKHKGYGTYLHIKNLKNFGPCKIHRKTFFPVKKLAKNEFI